jgi:type IV secretory pathway TraG/TraD family ATPase VirD4
MPPNANQNALPWRFPAFRALAVLLAAACSVVTASLWCSVVGPLKPFYLVRYARLSLLSSTPRADYSINKSFRQQAPTFDVLFVGNSVATTANLSQLAGQTSVRSFAMEPKAFCAWLKQNIYEGRTAIETIHVPLYLAETYLCLFFFAGYCLDTRKRRKARNGLTLRGPGIVSRWRFNQKTRGDGLAFPVTNPRNLLELLTGADSSLRIQRNKESHHIQIAGDTGSGKSTMIRQILRQIEARGDVAIVFDPDCEYIQEFFHEERGDWVLNPLDERCPYWEIENEAMTEAQAASISLSLWPDEPNQQPFFKKHPRAIFAYLLSRYNRYNCPEDPATCASLARWLATPREEITPRLEGTRHAVSTDANAKDQSQGLWATLGEVATPLAMMPPFDECRREWTVRDWADTRQGWIFITSTPDTLDALRPLQSCWLDMLILKLQSPSQSKTRAWMILDELAALNQLPQLKSALTRQRKYDNPIVLGFQGMAQIADAYGDKKAETILSQAYTNIILRTREPHGAQHLSNLIGKAQLERLRESQPSRMFEARQGSYNTERVVDPVVMDSEIQTLGDLTGYFVQKDNIVPITFQPMPKHVIAPAFIERVIEPLYCAKANRVDVQQRQTETNSVVVASGPATNAVVHETGLTKKAKDILFADH